MAPWAPPPPNQHYRYYNDLWELDVNEMTWTPVGDPSSGPWPPCRSGCQLLLQGDTLFMYGGYVKVGWGCLLVHACMGLCLCVCACGGDSHLTLPHLTLPHLIPPH
jgi:hypothetical protein